MECDVDGCTRTVIARGWCNLHYQRWHRSGNPGAANLMRLPDHAPCSVDGCNRANRANGYCEMHRWRVRQTGEPGPAEKKKAHTPKRSTPCVVEGCDRTGKSKRAGSGPFCHLHYERQRLGRPIGPPGPMIAESGSGTVQNGYRRVRVGTRRGWEHTFVMEGMLGRRLLPEESIHHKNGFRDDNRPENLELWAQPGGWKQRSGQRVADLIAFVVEHYPDDVSKALAARD